MSLSPCPRCQFPGQLGAAVSLAQQQVRACAYCRENERRILAGERALPEPTPQFPTWQPPS